MAYFPNGTSGLVYQEKYCDRCQNNKDKDDGRGTGCPIWDMHTVHNYDQVKNKDFKRILESFIPTKKDGFPDKCLMFDCIEGEIEGQLHLRNIIMSDKQCREDCDVYKDWLKAGKTITDLEEIETDLNSTLSYTEMGVDTWKARAEELEIENERLKGEVDGCIQYLDDGVFPNQPKSELERKLSEAIYNHDEAIIKLEAELAEHEWLSVKDRLPEDASYIVFRYASSGNTFFGFYRPSRKQWVVNIDRNGQRVISDNDWPTHWMTIPALPEPKKEGE